MSAQEEIDRLVAAIDDPVGECRRRLRGFELTVNRDVPDLHQPILWCVVNATWTVDGAPHQLMSTLANDVSRGELEKGKRHLARAILFSDERRRRGV